MRGCVDCGVMGMQHPSPPPAPCLLPRLPPSPTHNNPACNADEHGTDPGQPPAVCQHHGSTVRGRAGAGRLRQGDGQLHAHIRRCQACGAQQHRARQQARHQHLWQPDLDVFRTLWAFSSRPVWASDGACRASSAASCAISTPPPQPTELGPPPLLPTTRPRCTAGAGGEHRDCAAAGRCGPEAHSDQVHCGTEHRQVRWASCQGRALKPASSSQGVSGGAWAGAGAVTPCDCLEKSVAVLGGTPCMHVRLQIATHPY